MHLLDSTYVADQQPGASVPLSDSLIPMFSLDRVQFSFPGSLKSLVVSNNWLVVALQSQNVGRDNQHSHYILWIDLGQTQSIEGSDPTHDVLDI
jgi:hypothetical protein